MHLRVEKAKNVVIIYVLIITIENLFIFRRISLPPYFKSNRNCAEDPINYKVIQFPRFHFKFCKTSSTYFSELPHSRTDYTSIVLLPPPPVINVRTMYMHQKLYLSLSMIGCTSSIVFRSNYYIRHFFFYTPTYLYHSKPLRIQVHTYIVVYSLLFY